MFAFSNLATISGALQLYNGGNTDAAVRLLCKFYDRPGTPIEMLLNLPSTRLAVYGSLAPGERNQHILTPIPGSWSRGSVYGTFSDTGWGTSLGFRSLVWDAGGGEVAVQVFESSELTAHWSRIDEFEGSDYRRILVPVVTSGGILVANLFAARP